MSLPDYLTVMLAVALYQPTKIFVLGSNKAYRKWYHWLDLFGESLETRHQCLTKVFGNVWVPCVAVALLTLAFYPVLSWGSIDPTHQLRVVISTGAMILAWKSATMDIDLATGHALILERFVVIGSAIGVVCYPGFLFVLLFGVTHFFRGWTHHQQLIIRSSIMFLAGCIGFLIVRAFYDLDTLSLSGMFLIVIVVGSHYVVPGVSKLRLGPHWNSWLWRNQLHSLASSAYMWGWCRFLPERLVIGCLSKLGRIDRLTQSLAVFLELSAGFLLFDQVMAPLILSALALFHLGVFLLSGIMFWQNFVMLLLISNVLLFLDSSENDGLYGSFNGTLACFLMFALPCILNVWRPFKLAWWDTPFIDRVDWLLEGESGKIYGLYNDFMAPNDRLFGNESGYFLSKSKRITQHLGQTSSYEVATEIHAALPSHAGLHELIEQFGVEGFDAAREEEHDRYMLAFFKNYNQGKPKHVCPKWAKAPGDQCFYWGVNEKFQGQEKVRRLMIRHRQEIFNGKKIVEIKNELLKTIELPLS